VLAFETQPECSVDNIFFLFFFYVIADLK